MEEEVLLLLRMLLEAEARSVAAMALTLSDNNSGQSDGGKKKED